MKATACASLLALVALAAPIAAFAAIDFVDEGALVLHPAAGHRALISEAGSAGFNHTTTLCNPAAVGSVAACFNSGIAAMNNYDWNITDPHVAYPTDGSPWGVHLVGPYPDQQTYLVSWHSGAPVIGSSATLTQPDTSAMIAQVRISTMPMGTEMGDNMCACAPGSGALYTGKVITYLRNFTVASGTSNYSYVSPYISHVVVPMLNPATTYYYIVGNGSVWSQQYNFTTLPTWNTPKKYPIRLGTIADIGQTVNSTATRDYLYQHNPQAILFPGDHSYADDYGAINPNAEGSGTGTNQQRWDSYFVLWEKVFSSSPMMTSAGNHELETANILAAVNYSITNFSYPTDYPFQTYSARLPVPGTTSNFGNIDNNLYYATKFGGAATVISLTNYAPFHSEYTLSNGTVIPASPQWTWAMSAFAAVNRTETPWLFVLLHAPIYHTYYTHYKEMECFRSFYEDVFYTYGVDVILQGHVHAYERTHGMYNYALDSCGPMYITIGDGGNIEGPYRDFVDQVDPNSNKTYCEELSYSGQGPNGIRLTNPSGWGPSYQLQAQPPECPTLSFQPSYNVKSTPPLVLLNTTDNLNSANPVGFCQSAQPLWSAYRDASFGHGILTLMSDTVAEFAWYRNIDGGLTPADVTTIERQTACASKRRRMMEKLEGKSVKKQLKHRRAAAL